LLPRGRVNWQRLSGRRAAYEPDELRKLLPTAGACRLHSQEVGRPADFRCADAVGIMHLMQFAFGMVRADERSS
jgi:hypothetical protein